MATEEAQAKYAHRRHPSERPFAEIKQRFGVRQCFLRSLDRVKREGRWLTTAFRLDRLISIIRSRASCGCIDEMEIDLTQFD